MATEKRLMLYWDDVVTAIAKVFKGRMGDCIYSPSEVLSAAQGIRPADAVELSRLGRLGKLMMPYAGCPRGPIGASGEPGSKWKPMELDAIKDMDGNRWVPVLEQDLERLKGVEVVHGRWIPTYHTYYNREGASQIADEWHCSECGIYSRSESNYCPNCGAKMDGDWNG